MRFNTAKDLKGCNLIVEKRGQSLDEKGNVKGVYLDVQIDQSLMKPENAQTNPHLASHVKEFKDENGKDVKYTSHDVYYAKSQWDAMVAAANSGKKSKQAVIDGNEVIGLNANLVKNAKGMMIINTKDPMAPTKNMYFGKNVLDKQRAVTQEVSGLKKSAKDVEATVEKGVEKDTPEIEIPEMPE